MSLKAKSRETGVSKMRGCREELRVDKKWICAPLLPMASTTTSYLHIVKEFICVSVLCQQQGTLSSRYRELIAVNKRNFPMKSEHFGTQETIYYMSGPSFQGTMKESNSIICSSSTVYYVCLLIMPIRMLASPLHRIIHILNNGGWCISCVQLLPLIYPCSQ